MGSLGVLKEVISRHRWAETNSRMTVDGCTWTVWVKIAGCKIGLTLSEGWVVIWRRILTANGAVMIAKDSLSFTPFWRSKPGSCHRVQR